MTKAYLTRRPATFLSDPFFRSLDQFFGDESLFVYFDIHLYVAAERFTPSLDALLQPLLSQPFSLPLIDGVFDANTD